MQLEGFIRDVPDFPKKGIIFKDITPLLADTKALKVSIERLAEQVRDLRPDVLLGIESRGFIFGGALAVQLGCGLLIARKPGKLPYEKDQVSYDLEYGSATLELHRDAVRAGQRVLIIDDLLATGGTAAAAAELVEKQGGQVAGFAFVIELAELDGREKLSPHPVKALLEY